MAKNSLDLKIKKKKKQIFSVQSVRNLTSYLLVTHVYLFA